MLILHSVLTRKLSDQFKVLLDFQDVILVNLTKKMAHSWIKKEDPCWVWCLISYPALENSGLARN